MAGLINLLLDEVENGLLFKLRRGSYFFGIIVLGIGVGLAAAHSFDRRGSVNDFLRVDAIRGRMIIRMTGVAVMCEGRSKEGAGKGHIDALPRMSLSCDLPLRLALLITQPLGLNGLALALDGESTFELIDIEFHVDDIFAEGITDGLLLFADAAGAGFDDFFLIFYPLLEELYPFFLQIHLVP